MTDFHISYSDKLPGLPKYDTRIKCQVHPDAEPMDHYGMAGGGVGECTVCSQCGRVLSKTVDRSQENGE